MLVTDQFSSTEMCQIVWKAPVGWCWWLFLLWWVFCVLGFFGVFFFLFLKVSPTFFLLKDSEEICCMGFF